MNKKTLNSYLSVFSVLALVACGSRSKGNDKPQPAKNTDFNLLVPPEFKNTASEEQYKQRTQDIQKLAQEINNQLGINANPNGPLVRRSFALESLSAFASPHSATPSADTGFASDTLRGTTSKVNLTSSSGCGDVRLAIAQTYQDALARMQSDVTQLQNIDSTNLPEGVTKVTNDPRFAVMYEGKIESPQQAAAPASAPTAAPTAPPRGGSPFPSATPSPAPGTGSADSEMTMTTNGKWQVGGGANDAIVALSMAINHDTQVSEPATASNGTISMGISSATTAFTTEKRIEALQRFRVSATGSGTCDKGVNKGKKVSGDTAASFEGSVKLFAKNGAQNAKIEESLTFEAKDYESDPCNNKKGTSGNGSVTLSVEQKADDVIEVRMKTGGTSAEIEKHDLFVSMQSRGSQCVVTKITDNGKTIAEGNSLPPGGSSDSNRQPSNGSTPSPSPSPTPGAPTTPTQPTTPGTLPTDFLGWCKAAQAYVYSGRGMSYDHYITVSSILGKAGSNVNVDCGTSNAAVQKLTALDFSYNTLLSDLTPVNSLPNVKKVFLYQSGLDTGSDRSCPLTTAECVWEEVDADDGTGNDGEIDIGDEQ